MKQRRTYLILGIALGLMGFLIVQSTLSGAQRTVSVVVAKTFLPSGTIINDTDVEVKQVHPSAVLKGAFHEKQQAVGKRIAVERAPGDQIAQEHLGDAQSIKLEPGWRAVAVKVDAQRGLAGKIAAGDKVSVVGVFASAGMPEETEAKPLAKVLMTGVEVLFVTHSFIYRAPQTVSTGTTSGGGLVPAITVPQRQAESGIVILKVPAGPVKISYVEYKLASSEVVTKEVGSTYVDPVELITYLDANNALYLVMEPSGEPISSGTHGLRMEDLFIPERRVEKWRGGP